MSPAEAVAILTDPGSRFWRWLAAIAELEDLARTPADAPLVTPLIAALERELARDRTVLTDDDHGADRRELLARALATFKHDAAPAIPVLRTLQRTAPHQGLEQSARAALEAVSDEHAVRVSLERLDDPSPSLRRFGALRLGALGPAARSAVPRLTALLRDDGWNVAVSAAAALAEIGDPSVIPALEAALEGPRPAVVAEAAWALATLGPPSCAALPALRRARSHWSLEVRWEAARAVAALDGGPLEPAALEEPAASDEGMLLTLALAGRAPLQPRPEERCPPDWVAAQDHCAFAADGGTMGIDVSLFQMEAPHAHVHFSPASRGTPQLAAWGDGLILLNGHDDGEFHHDLPVLSLIHRRRRPGGSDDGWIIDTLAVLPGRASRMVVLEDEIIVFSVEECPPGKARVHTAFGVNATGTVRRLATGRW